jgi:hypothetical protein
MIKTFGCIAIGGLAAYVAGATSNFPLEIFCFAMAGFCTIGAFVSFMDAD